ncbi:MAG: tRNA dihydrouridine synthase DusB [Epsilonproteobacteria bacterium]|nr:tRNA dihydrouridine synthase DusB [Campylobacterota bacterium]OIO13228.1 MAG: tRNA dihydrouridine synthase DusB [Helicobacteraceae bacterium CG1_02_36_14]PIP10445.1 MAG: tRNA dihydrouridine synthase DusB [Sulfurimonas sp. CG23_combo_of_CG06-09_8_20_14_all_36_33]PIS26660.1 MAG: tRNA dihydrouridine synthase DusB [Sulfurimonas sp. CG08_land_8_20_14_0_20_36_33]PIU33471.1 MAG: tRNA dihydrouridine synthase DusB [Sulfurimonas sp. CG07_land_8_20_14_0_80_36_56]PIV04915.1 MAG: tRNA dihydrouridine syn
MPKHLEKLSFKNPIYVLAPLAGYTDLPFRSVVKKFGADLTVSEMLSSNALVHGSKKTLHMIQKSPLEEPYSVQIAGAEVDVIRRAVEILNDEIGIDIIDLNCGCPVPKVVGHGSGSSLLLNLPLMGGIIRTIKDTSNKSMTSVKIRLGFEKKNHIEIAKMVEDSGADFIAVHGRTRAGKFKAAVDYDAIREIKEALSIPVIANGDIDSFEKAKWVLEHTGADGIMIGRGAVGAPWIFHQLKNGSQEIDKNIKHEIIMEHFDKMVEFYGLQGIPMFRKHTHTYSKGYRGASVLRNDVNRITNPSEYRGLIDEFFKNNEILV